MHAAVTERIGSIIVGDRPEPPDPGPGEVLIRPEAVGICGSDYHFFTGELSDAAGGSQFPRVQGHEVAATIAALGRDCRAGLEVGQRVALWPLRACGGCYPCSVGRPNACDNFELIGIHRDGGLQEGLITGQEQVFGIDASDGAVAATAAPVSIAGRAVRRGGLGPWSGLFCAGGSWGTSASGWSGPARSGSASRSSPVSSGPRC